MSKSQPRVPEPATFDLSGSERAIQVNHCKMPDCSSFGVPARTKPGKTGPSTDRDMHHKLHSTKGGQIPSIRCKACLDNPPVRSNASIVKQIERLAEEAGIWTLEESMGCRDADCENNDWPVAFHPDEYRRRACTTTIVASRWTCSHASPTKRPSAVAREAPG